MIYDFKCVHCGEIIEDVYLAMTHEDHEHPMCCGLQSRHYITRAPMVHFKDFELKDGGYVSHSMKGKPVITSIPQERELLKRHNLINASEMGQPPTKADQIVQNRKDEQLNKQFEVPDYVKREMTAQGLDNIIDSP